MKNRTKKVATLALTPLLLISLAGCSGATKEEMKEGLKENIAYLDYGFGIGNAEPDEDWLAMNDDRINRLADCIVESAYDDLSPSGRNTVASGSHEKLTFDDDDYEVMDRASQECGW